MGTYLSRAQLVQEIYDRPECADLGVRKADIRAVLKALGEVVQDALVNAAPSERITVIPGKLKVYKHVRPATEGRMGRNPKTGEDMWIEPKPARSVPKASFGKDLRKAASIME